MRRLFIIIVAIVFSGSHSQAQQNLGQPSNLVGSWTMTLQPGTHLVSFPLLPENATPMSVFRDQLPGGLSWSEASRIVTVQNGVTTGSFYNSSTGEWEGTLNDLNLRYGYWLVIPDGSESIDLRLVGAAMDADTLHMGLIEPGMSLVSAGYPFPTTMEGSGLLVSGFSSAEYRVVTDRIHSWSAGNLVPAWHHPQLGWQGQFMNFNPEFGYVIVVVNEEGGFEWRRPHPGRREIVPPAMRLGRPHGSRIRSTVPVPDLSRPPWGDRVQVNR